MQQLLMRNLYLRRWTLILYSILLLIFPIYRLANKDTALWVQIIIFLLNIIIIIDSAHAFRLFRRLGHREAYIFYHSLPVSKLQLFHAHYLTVILLTAFGALLIQLYDVQETMVDFNGITFSTFWLYISVNLFTFIIGFPRYSEKMTDHIPIVAYIIAMFFVIPFVIGIILITLGILKYDNPLYYSPLDVGFWYFMLALGLAIIVYFYNLITLMKR